MGSLHRTFRLNNGEIDITKAMEQRLMAFKLAYLRCSTPCDIIQNKLLS